MVLSDFITENSIPLKPSTLLVSITITVNEQPREDARLRGGSLIIEPCAIVPGAEKISHRCNID